MIHTKRFAVAAALAAAAVVAGAVALTLSLRSTPPAGPTSRPSLGAGGPSGAPPVFIHYYLWWTPAHWRSTLGPAYPLAAAESAGVNGIGGNPAASPPLPGSVGADGCGTGASFAGSNVLDLPAEGLYDQASPATFDHHIDLAVKSSVTGFLVDWQGTGLPGQNPSSSGYNGRLDLMVQRVDAYNADHGTHFSLGLAFAAFGNYNRPASQIIADLQYFRSRYAKDPAFATPFSPSPVVMMMDSRKFSVDTVAAVSRSLGASVYLVGDETASSWPRDAPYLDASSYYWSSENPYKNTQAGASIDALAKEVRTARKRWFAPVIAGYDKQLLSGQCVPRNDLQTLDTLWKLNGASHPDGWFAISWNEFVENTYLEPSVRYGSKYLDELARLIRAQAGNPSP